MISQRGFTLIELVTVIVVLSIVAAFSTQFIVTSLDSYSTNKRSNDLVNTSRAAMEQIARYLRSAVPNSARVSSSGNCLEVMPSTGGAFYEGQVPDAENGAASVSSVVTSSFSLGLGDAEHAVIGALDSSEIYTASSPSARADINSTVGNPIQSIQFDLPHRFMRNSINQRVYVGESPKRFCLAGGSLVLYENYGLITTAMDDSDPGGGRVLMANNVSAQGSAFQLSAGTEDRSASVDMSLVFSLSNTRVALQQTVLIRNVP